MCGADTGKTAAVPIGRNLVSERDFLANSWRPRLAGTITHLAAIFFLMQKKKTGKSALTVIPSHSDV